MYSQIPNKLPAITLFCLLILSSPLSMRRAVAAEAYPSIRVGEIELKGVIADMDPIGPQFTLQVQQVQGAEGPPRTLSIPRNKTIKAGSTISLFVDGYASPASCSVLHHGETILAIGPNSGTGLPLNARLIATPGSSLTSDAPTMPGIPAALGMSGPVAGDVGEVSGVLALVSDDYQFGDQTNSRVPDLQRYIPFLQSRNARVREVAALSAVWQQDASLLMVSHDVQNSLDDLVGFETPGTSSRQLFDPNSVKSHVRQALFRAISGGALTGYTNKNFWRDAETIFPAVRDRSADDMFKGQSNANACQLILAKMRAILHDRAEAMGRSVAGPVNSRPNDLVVTGVFVRGQHWGTVRISNRSSTAISHVTLSLRSDKSAAVRNRGLEGLLVGVASTAGGNDLPEQAKAANDFIESIDSWFSTDEMPIRVLIHLPVIPAGGQCEVPLFDSSQEFAKTRSAVYSLWADQVVLERQPLPGYEAELKRFLDN